MRILFVNQFFYPDTSATSQLLTDLAVDLAAAGHEISVLTSNAEYHGGRETLAAREVYRSVIIRRVFCGRFDRESPLRRASSYLRFLFGVGVRLFRRRPPDVVFVLTTPPLVALLPALLQTWRGVPYVCWVQDVYPEVAVAVGAIAPTSRAVRLAAGLNGYIYASAAAVVALGSCMERLLRDTGVSPKKLHVIHNWADGQAIRPTARRANPFLRGLGVRDEFVVLYSGNLGRGHEFETLTGAMLELRASPAIRFMVIGDGARLSEVTEFVRKWGLTNVSFLPPQPRADLSLTLSAGDVGIVSTRSGCEGTMVASKIYGLLAAGRPYIYIGPVATTMAEVAEVHQCGWHIAEGDIAGLCRLLQSLRRQPELVAAAGLNARAALEAVFDRPHGVRQFEMLLSRVAGRIPRLAAADESPTSPIVHAKIAAAGRG